MGDKLYPPNESNPKGFFENEGINGLNEQILSQYDKSIWRLLRLNRLKTRIEKKFPRIMRQLFCTNIYAPGYMQRWLISLPFDQKIDTCDRGIIRRIKRVVDHTPYCYKDPRFSYTLPVWKRYMPTEFIALCIFREPNITVKSIIKECRTANYLANLHITEDQAYEVWCRMYAQIIEKHYDPQNFVFAHYNQIYTGQALSVLSERLGADLKNDFVSKDLRRTMTDAQIPPKALAIYEKLCALAEYETPKA
jgi:hypothetical protein